MPEKETRVKKKNKKNKKKYEMYTMLNKVFFFYQKKRLDPDSNLGAQTEVKQGRETGTGFYLSYQALPCR